jgi:hypothetical protein
MRRAAVVAGLGSLAACRPIFYDLIDSAGPEETTTTMAASASETMSDPSGDDSTGGETAPGTGEGSTEQPPPPPPRCDDGVRNGLETGLDCGGPDCPPCFPGECQAPEDCDTKICVAGKCLPPQCQFAKDCPSEQCRAPECDPVTRQCVLHDLDGLGCEDGDQCTLGDVCKGGLCVSGGAPDCSGLDGPCQLGFCNPKTGNCGVEFVGEGMPCEDGIACTVDDMCIEGQCTGKPTPAVFFADFSTPQGWQLDEWWQIGPAKLSLCAEIGSDDPSEDHSPGVDQMLAGALIGECLPAKPLPQDACLTSPPIDASLVGPLWLTYYSRVSSPPAPAEARVEVWDGQQWALLWSSKGQPVDEPTWTEHLVDVTLFKNPKLQVRFCHHHPVEGLPVVAGWSVDDVALGLPGCFPP